MLTQFILRLLGRRPVKVLDDEHVAELGRIFAGCVVEVGVLEDWAATSRLVYIHGSPATRVPDERPLTGGTPGVRVTLDGLEVVFGPCYDTRLMRVAGAVCGNTGTL